MNGPGHSLESIAFLDPLDEPSRRSLEQRARWVRHKQGETIIDRESESRDVYFVVDGRARVVNFSLSGREISFDDIENGGVFGLSSVRSETARRSRAFSFSSSFRRFAWSTRNPPYSRRHR